MGDIMHLISNYKFLITNTEGSSWGLIFKGKIGGDYHLIALLFPIQ
jgi:hypothetical protein